MFVFLLLLIGSMLTASQKYTNAELRLGAVNAVLNAHLIPKDVKLLVLLTMPECMQSWQFDRIQVEAGNIFPGLSSVYPAMKQYQIKQYRCRAEWDDDRSWPLLLECNDSHTAQLNFSNFLQSHNSIRCELTDKFQFFDTIIDCHGYKRVPFTPFKHFAYPIQFQKVCDLIKLNLFEIVHEEMYSEKLIDLKKNPQRGCTPVGDSWMFNHPRMIAIRALNSQKEIYFYYDLDRISLWETYAFVINAVCTDQYVFLEIQDLYMFNNPGVYFFYQGQGFSEKGRHRIEIFDIRLQLDDDKANSVIKLSSVIKVGEINLPKEEFLLWSVDHDSTLVLKQRHSDDAGIKIQSRYKNKLKGQDIFVYFKPSQLSIGQFTMNVPTVDNIASTILKKHVRRWYVENLLLDLQEKKSEEERLEGERLEREKSEEERLEREKSEEERLERERLEGERLEGERLEGERLERERLERERLEGERLEGERLEGERLERERLERERKRTWLRRIYCSSIVAIGITLVYWTLYGAKFFRVSI